MLSGYIKKTKNATGWGGIVVFLIYDLILAA